LETKQTSKFVQSNLEARNILNSSTLWSPEQPTLKPLPMPYKDSIFDIPLFKKATERSFLMQQIRVNGNCQNKWTSRIYQGAIATVF